MSAIRLALGRATIAVVAVSAGSASVFADDWKDVVALQSRAIASLRAGRFDDTIQDETQALKIARGLDRPRLLAVLFRRLGGALELANRPQDSVIAYEAGLTQLALTDRRTELGEALESLSRVAKGTVAGPSTVPADLYSAEFDHDLAEAEADRQLAVELLIDTGNAYLRQPQPEPALNAYRRALALPEIADAPKLRAYALANAGEIFRRNGEVDEAERSLKEALELLREHAEAVEARRALALLAGIHRDRGRPDEALAEYQEALTLYRQAQDPRGEGRAQAGLGRLHLEAKRFPEARAAYARAVDLGEQAHDSESSWYAHWGLGQAQRMTGDLAGAAASLERSLDIIETRQQDLRTDEGKITLLDSVQDVYDQLIVLHLERGRSDASEIIEALRVAERARGRAMRDLLGSAGTRRMSCPVPGEHLKQNAPAVASPAQMAPATTSGGSFAEILPDPRCARIGAAPTTVNAPPLRRLVFHVLSDRLAVFAVENERVLASHVAPLGRDALTTRVAALRDALAVDEGGRGVHGPRREEDSTSDDRALLRRMYADLIAPVADALPAGEPLVIEPHGPLWLVPFAALIGGDGRYLADRWPILYAPSSSVLDEIRGEMAFKRPDEIQALIVGNPTPPGLTTADDDRFRQPRLRATFEPLPGAEREARAIAQVFPEGRRKVLIGSDADEATVRAGMRESNVIHLATHALAFPGQPLDSFVMLAARSGDGRLTAREVLGLSFAADLVTLSACQTGLGQLSGDGVLGLSRAFLARGARSVVVSQWSVSDEATASLMTSFYGAYVAGKDKARALQLAMKEVREHPGFEHPKYWAPFILVGSER